MIKTYSEIFEKVKKNARRPTIAVALAEDKSVMEAIKVLSANDIARVILTGNPKKIKSYAEQVG